jgi:DNA-binding GntR family transcriptional regulator
MWERDPGMSQVPEDLLKAILKHLAPRSGDVFSAEELASRFKVSVTRIKPILEELEKCGLLFKKGNQYRVPQREEK